MPIIFGWGRQSIKSIGVVFKNLCSHCHNEEYWIMTRIVTWFTLFFIALSVARGYSAVQINNLEPFKKTDRILILAPHPDDETIACAGVIQEALKKKSQLKIVYLTNGDHNEIAFIVYERRLTFKQSEFIHMGQVRKKEAIIAMKTLGVNENNLIFLGYPDYGTFAIFSQYWQDSKPFKDALTRISAVPYKDNFSFGAPYKGENILGDLKKVLSNYKPNKIFVSSGADVNVDHKSLYLFLQVALRDLNKEYPMPKVYPYLVHCAGWPLPRRYHPELGLMPPEKFLDSQISWQKLELNPEQLDKKYKAVLCYPSQTRSSAFYLFSFCRKNELFADHPVIELKKQVSLKGQSQSEADTNYAIEGHFFLIRIKKTDKITSKLNLIIYLFSYSRKTPFAQMPKLRIITKYNKFKIFSGKSQIKPANVSLEADSETITLKLPLQLLADPDFILVSIKDHRGNLPVDLSGFRRIEIK